MAAGGRGDSGGKHDADLDARPNVAPRFGRRDLFRVGSGVAILAGLAACAESTAVAGPIGPRNPRIAELESLRRQPGATVREFSLTPQPMQVDLGGPIVPTWSYTGDAVGRPIRATAGDVLRVHVDNRLPGGVETDGGGATTVHWHGLALRNDMDGVPDVTQAPIASGRSGVYEFTAPDPGTYWYHSHVGVQRDRALVGPLIIDDPAEPGRYDVEFIVVLDDWLDGLGGASPDSTLSTLRRGGMTMGGMSDADGEPPSAVGSDGGDVQYPYYLINGRIPDAPVTFTARPGQRARLRVINAAADTAFRVALDGHQLTVVHADGYPTAPIPVDTLVLGSGERYDLEVVLGSGVFPLVAVAEGKQGAGRALLRTSPGAAAPPSTVVPAALSRRLLSYGDLRAAPSVALPERTPDRTHQMVLTGDMATYRWMINGRVFGSHEPLPVREGERVRLRVTNQTSMYHPVHLHGHTFALRGGSRDGVRKDTVNVLPGQSIDIDFDADNPGQWLAHCHLSYHEAAGMMTVVSYGA